MTEPDIEVKERRVKLARSQMRHYAHKLWVDQGKCCAICRKPLDLTIKGEGVLDHDHDTGWIRGVLHRSCNAAEGKVSNAAGQWGAKSTQYPAIKQWLRQLLEYLDSPHQKFIYPYHKDENEKRQARKTRTRRNSAAARARALLAKRAEGGTEHPGAGHRDQPDAGDDVRDV